MQRLRAVVAPPARRGLLVVQLPAQELHPAAGGRRILAHRALLRLPGGGDLGVAGGVVLPALPGGRPAAPDPADGAVHVEHLEHGLQPGPAQVHPGLQGGGGERAAGLGQRVDGAAHLLLRREGQRGEVAPDRLVLAPGQQQHLGPVHAAPGPADLLVVGDRRAGRAEVHHEAEVGLVEAHAERGGGDQRLDPVGEQVGLGGAALGVLSAAGVGGHREAALAQEGRHLLGRGHGQGVDDAGAGEPVEVVGQPGEPVRRVGQGQYAQGEALPVERSAQHQGALVGGAGAELLGDVRGDPGVGGGGRGQHRDTGRQLREHGAQPAVVGAEVVPPVRDAVRLVDHQQAGGGGELGQHLVAEVGVVQPLGADQQDVDLPGGDLGLDLVPLVGVGRVDGAGVDAGPGRRLHLVAHQGEQRRDDHRRPGTAGPEQGGGDEVDRGLPPAGALDDQGAAVVDHEGLDGRPLVLAQGGGGAGELAQDGLGPRPDLGAVGGGGGVGVGLLHGVHVTPCRRQAANAGEVEEGKPGCISSAGPLNGSQKPPCGGSVACSE